MIKMVKRNKNKILLLGIVVLILGTTVLPAVLPKPVGNIGGGFMKDGERVPPGSFLQSFAKPGGDPVDGVWWQVGWTVQGENVDWTTFRAWGFCGIRLWQSATHIILVNKSFDVGGEEKAFTHPHIGYTEMLADLLDNQPYSDPGNTLWVLYFWADFHMSVVPENPEYVGHTLYDMWDGETTGLTVHWIGGSFSGTGSVSSGW
jgi:hypothetical protein